MGLAMRAGQHSRRASCRLRRMSGPEKSKAKESEKVFAVKGMNDILPPDSAKWSYVEKRARSTFENHGYREVRTPLVEHTPLFVRSIGEATDVVEKEMYTFPDRSETQSLTLRPEGTAG